MIPSNIKNYPFKPSLDRLDINKGYIKDNVVLTSLFANLGRKTTSIEHMELLVKEIKRIHEIKETNMKGEIFKHISDTIKQYNNYYKNRYLVRYMGKTVILGQNASFASKGTAMRKLVDLFHTNYNPSVVGKTREEIKKNLHKMIDMGVLSLVQLNTPESQIKTPFCTDDMVKEGLINQDQADKFMSFLLANDPELVNMGIIQLNHLYGQLKGKTGIDDEVDGSRNEEVGSEPGV